MALDSKNIYVPLPALERGKPFVLSGDPKGKNFLYAHGNSIIVRSIENPLEAFTYTEHSVATTVAKYAPSGFYIASADVSGKVRIWDTTQAEHMLKYEYQPLSGCIKDLAWSPDSKRIVVCGEGREKYAQAFLWDSGSSVGEITGHSKFINSIDYRSDRPFRVVTASEDNDTGFYAGPPFKLQHLNHEHTRFANTVRYAGDGHVYVTGGADGKAFVYEGKEGKLLHELTGGATSAHDGQIYAISWSADNKRLITASGDRTVKMWDADENKLLVTFTFGDSVDDQQLACLWQGDHIISVSLIGFINYLDPSNPSKPKAVFQGHNKIINSIAVDGEGHFVAGSYDGRLSRFSISDGTCELFAGSSAHSIVALQLENGNIVSASLDDKVRITPVSASSLSEDAVACESAPVAVASYGNLSIVASVSHIMLLRNSKRVFLLPITFDGLSAAIQRSGAEAAVGGKDGKIHIFSIHGDTLQEKKVIDASGSVETLEYSPDGAYLASGDSGRNVFVFDVTDYSKKMDRWKFHSAKVTCLAWSPNSQHIASGSLDTNIIIWNMANEMKRITKKAAHPMSAITSIRWIDDNTVISSGFDVCVRTWTVKHV